MIAANELRIGHLYNDGENYNPFVFTETLWGNGLDFRRFLDMINPIPLTPEILEKCGFERKLRDLFIELDNGRIYFSKDSFIELTYGDLCEYRPIKMEHIKYVHQLQNLYFALTDEELIYKP